MEIISVYTQDKTINVNNESLHLEFNIPEIFPKNFFYLLWWEHENYFAYFTINNGDVNDQTEHKLSGSEEDYNTYVKPFVDQWQAEKDRIEAEQKYFPNHQAKAFEQLNEEFEQAKERAHVKSSLGFTVDANQTANENVNGLLVTIGDGTVFFCDYNNEFHELNRAQLETLQKEIIQNAQNLYTQKWQYRTSIEECTEIEELTEIVDNIDFWYMEFQPQEAPTGESDGGSAEQTE